MHISLRHTTVPEPVRATTPAWNTQSWSFRITSEDQLLEQRLIMAFGNAPITVVATCSPLHFGVVLHIENESAVECILNISKYLK
jgi:hypothetical protein